MKFKYLLIILLSLGLFFVHPGKAYSQKDFSDTLIQPSAQFLDSSDIITIDIKANGSDGPLGVTTTENVSFTISLDPINLLGQLADWWMIILRSPLDDPDSWELDEFHHLGQLPLFFLPPYFLFDREFSSSNWRIYFAVDMVPNYQLDTDQMYYDYVDITSTDCFPDLPSPVLVHTGTEDYQNEYTIYRLKVINSEDFPDDLFAEAPYLPPCGLNPYSSRTWVNIYDNEDNYLYGFCGAGSSEILKNDLCFTKPKGTPPPECVYITLNDRFCDLTFTSNCVPLREGLTQCVDFEDLPLDMKYYVSDTFHDSGATISVLPFQWSNGQWTNGGAALIGDDGDAGGSGKEVWINNVILGFEFLTSSLSGLSVNFGEYGGNLNLEINGEFINVENFAELNSKTLGGVSIFVTNGFGNDQGTLTLDGEINQFAIGGQELAVDDVCPQIASVEIYFTDAGEGPGSVYHFQPEIPAETAIYTRPSNELTDFSFSPWSQDKIYFVNAINGKEIFVKDISGAIPETVIYTHNTYVRDIAFDSKGDIYFSESTGAEANGMIWRLEKGGSISLFYTVVLSEVDGFWAGDFTFDNNDVPYVSSGNHIPACIYKVDVLANTVTKVYTDNSGAIAGMVFGEDGLLYYADWEKKIYRLDLASGQSDVIYQNPLRTHLSDVSFPVPEIPPTDAEGTWIMPYGVGRTSLDKIQADGLTDYTDGLSGLHMEDAPFGARLRFRLESANVIPTTTLKYYRFQYKHESEVSWHDFVENVSVHYVKEKGTDPPVFPLFNLGPYDIGGKNLYKFRPHEANLPALVGALPDETVYWPTTGFFNDLFRAFLDTEVLNLGPGRYKIRIEVYNSTGSQVMPGASTFHFVVPIGVGSGGTILTSLADPGSVVAGGFEFTIHIDNTKCTAIIHEPTIELIGAGDCGFLRYDPELSSPVNISFQVTHPANFALFRFKIVRGPNVVGITKVHGFEVSAASAGVYIGDGSGNFQHSFLPEVLLGPDCFEAAFSENAYVYAKATTGWHQRINKFDASAVRAFALTPF